MSRTRWFDVAAIALTIAVLAGLAYVARAQQTPTLAVSTAAAEVDRPQPPAKDPPTVLFIGDSYTVGTGVRETSYGCAAATRMGWLCRLSAGPGTGYISGGPGNRFVVNEYIGRSTSFAERLPGLAAKYDPRIVFLDGGRNDVFASPSAELEAMLSTISDVHQTWPAATIVVIRPRFVGRPADDLGYDDDFIAALQADPRAQDVVVIDPINALNAADTSGLLSADGIHPNERGELALSAALLNTLRQRGIEAPK
jgi:lysophospholipase L1-like esterase